MDKSKKKGSKLTSFLNITMINGDNITTELEQINMIAESQCLIAMNRYSEDAPRIFRKISPIVINPKYIVEAVRVDGKVIEGDK